MKRNGDKMSRIRQVSTISVMFIIITSLFIVPLSSNLINNNIIQIERTNYLHSSAETVYNQEWLKNNDFSTQGDWVSTKGAQGDNSTTDSNISGGSANYIVVGNDLSFSVNAGEVNSSTWYGWGIYNNSDYLLPDVAEINATGCYVYHNLDENQGPNNNGQVHNFPSVHFRKNVSLHNDMSNFEIMSASLEVIFNASVDINVDAPYDIVDQYSIWDSVTFYVEIADLDLTFPFRVGSHQTETLGRDSPPDLSISDSELTYVSESDLITALNLALEKDPNHSEFTLILGMDIYCEDNDWSPGDVDTWNYLIFKSFNLTFNYRQEVDKFSSISWNQIGNTISGSNVQISDANLKFRYKIDQAWPSSLSPFSEIRIIINNNQYPETVRLSTATTSWQDAKVGGFDVTNLILKDVNISVSLQVFIANSFSLNNNITISIDDVYLNITYIETFADYETESQLFLETLNKTSDPFIQIPLGETVNITIKYLDNQTNHISGANVQLSGKISYQFNENSLFGQYSRIIDTNELGIGIWALTVTAQKSNYETQIIHFFVDVVERETGLQLFIDSIDKTSDPAVNIKYNEVFNVTVFYRDELTNQHLSGANVSITNFGDIPEVNEQYTISINSNMLNLGFNVLTIEAQSENYSSQIMQLYIKVYERATEFELRVNNEIISEQNNTIQIEVDSILNLTVFYRDNETKGHLSGAIVSLLSVGNFSEIGNQYNYTLKAISLSLGFNVLSIIAQFGNYESKSIQIYIEVYEIASNLTLKIDGKFTSALATIQVEVKELVNLTVYYVDNETGLHISGAIVSLDWDNFTEISSQYYYNLNTSTDLDQGITIVTIEAQFNNYQSQSIQIYFEVTERDTEIEVRVDGYQRSEAETISADVNQILNVTVFYRDDITKSHLSKANVTSNWVVNGSLRSVNLIEIGNQYNYSLNTNILAQGITILTVVAFLDNYQPRSFQFYIKVSERESEASLFLDSTPQSPNPLIELPFRSNLNITVKYLDNQTKTPIPGATVRLINKTNSEILYTFNEITAFNQYTLSLDTSELGVGGHLFEIVAFANNYKVKTLGLTLTLNKINARINSTSGKSYFSIRPSESIELSIKLIDADFNEVIYGANVTYRWAYGQGMLKDDDMDGNYTVEMENVPTGTYEIIISAYAGEEYSFNVFRITLNVVSVSPPDFTLLFISLAGGVVALVVAFTLYEVRFKYPPLVRKSRKVRKKISKGKKTKPIKDVTSRDDIIKKQVESNIETLQLEKKTENGLKEK